MPKEEFTISNDNFVRFQDDFYALLEKYGIKNPDRAVSPNWTTELLELEGKKAVISIYKKERNEEEEKKEYWDFFKEKEEAEIKKQNEYYEAGKNILLKSKPLGVK